MLDSQKLAIAAHLHVLLRRKTGRVTDTEWMVTSPEYAREIVRFTRLKAREEGCADLQDWAAKLEAAVLGVPAAAAPGPAAAAAAVAAPANAPQSVLDRLRDKTRSDPSYVGRLR